MLTRARVLIVTLLLIGATTSTLRAHPLGNFTINHLTKLTVGTKRVDVRYVVDMAEIPTYQTLHAVNPDGKSGAARLEGWGRREAATDISKLQLEENGTRCMLVLDGVRAIVRPGAGRLPMLYLVVRAHASLLEASVGRMLSYTDGTFPGRLGWHDVVVTPATEPTRELTFYPSALVSSPRATTAVEIAFDGDGRAVERASTSSDAASDGTAPASQARSNQLSDMLARGTNDSSFVLLTLRTRAPAR